MTSKHTTDRANAKLLAAAPQLLVALQLLVREIGSDMFALSPQQRRYMDLARIAIAEATEESE